MEIGIGLPNPIPGTPGALLVDWARLAEERGFATLATIDRVAYPSYDSLISLSAAAAVTERIGLMTNILIAPTRNPVLLAKEAASLDRISGGRFTLGLSVGGRPGDYEVVGRRFRDRGPRFDRDLELIHRTWAGDALAEGGKPVGPKPLSDRVPIMFGGTSDASIKRTVGWGVGWTAGGGSARRAAPFIERVRDAWAAAGRDDDPRFCGLAYFGLGGKEAASSRYIRHYYSHARYVDGIDSSVVRSPEGVRDALGSFEEAGFDEIVFDPTVADLAQIDLLAEVAL